MAPHQRAPVPWPQPTLCLKWQTLGYLAKVREVPAAAKALAILQYLASQPSPVSAALIAQEVGIPRSTTYQLLATLEAQAFVMPYPEERRFGLGPAAYELGAGYLRQVPLQRMARKPMAALKERVGFSVHLSVLHGRDVVYVLEDRVSGGPQLLTAVGVRLPAVRTASGRAMLAMLDAAQLRASLTAIPGLDRGTGHTRLSEVREELRLVRQRGYALESGEVAEGLASVAVAVLDSSEHPVASVAITHPIAAVSESSLDALAAEASKAARELGRRLGRRGNGGATRAP